MNVMDGSVLILFSLNSLAYSYILLPESRDGCKNISPQVYCASNIQKIRCNKVEFCKTYLRLTYCERGPEVYCKTKGSAESCGKEAYCLTWPDDSVTAVKVIPQTLLDRFGKAISDWLARTG